MERHDLFFKCQLCGRKYQMGAHKYDGKHIPKYKLDVCTTCYDGNWDGWAPHYEKTILQHLEENKLSPPERNSQGLLPRD